MNDMISTMNRVLAGAKIKGHCIKAEQARHQAYFDIKLEPGFPFRRLKSRGEDIALGLRFKTQPIIRLIPEKGVVRIQAPVRDADLLPFEELFFNTPLPADYLLPFVLGETNEGEALCIDFAKNPHLLIAGGTGSGKSVLLHNLINNALWLHASKIRSTELFLVDPKRVEFNKYKSSELDKVVRCVFHSYEETVYMLETLVAFMEARYAHMARLGITSVEENPNLFISSIVVIDEISDLMMQDKKIGKLQDLIVTLAQKARAAGIYLVLATQRPSTDVLTGLIKANFPGRIACKTASGTDSKVILDQPGAENLLGRGDAILRNMVIDHARFQVAFSTPDNTIKKFRELCLVYRNE